MTTVCSVSRLLALTAMTVLMTGCLSDSEGDTDALASVGTGGASSGPIGGEPGSPPPPPPPPPPSAPPSGKADPTVLYSYKPSLAEAAPVDGAEADPEPVYLFLEPSDEWLQRGIRYVDYLCCEGIEGPGAGTPHGPAMSVSYEPWALSIDLSAYEPGGVRKIDVVANFNDGSPAEKRSFRFNIAGGVEPNVAPSISGAPPDRVVADRSYVFTPDAVDPDGDTIGFSITNKPAWAEFDSVTGRLSGTPGTNDIGVYTDISIAVSDGRTSTSLTPFTITVESSGVGSVSLSWNPPTEREDGSPLTALSGYRLFFGQNSRDYSEQVRIDNPGITTYVVDNLTSGTWYFAMTAIDAEGLESSLSAEAVKTIP